MIGDYFRKIYEVRSEFDKRFDTRRIAYTALTVMFVLILLNDIFFQAGLFSITGSVLLVLSSVTLLTAFSLPRKQQPLIGHLTITGLVLLLVGGIIGIVHRLSIVFG